MRGIAESATAGSRVREADDTRVARIVAGPLGASWILTIRVPGTTSTLLNSPAMPSAIGAAAEPGGQTDWFAQTYSIAA